MTIQFAIDLMPVISGLTFLLCITLLPMLAIFKRTRAFAGAAYMVASYVFGAILWITSAMLTYSEWGTFALMLGIFVLGFGVFPMALFVLFRHSAWDFMTSLAITAAILYGCRIVGAWLVASAERATKNENP